MNSIEQPRTENPANPPSSQSSGTPQTHLQDVLPEIKDLSQRVGGMDRLAELVESLKDANE